VQGWARAAQLAQSGSVSGERAACLKVAKRGAPEHAGRYPGQADGARCQERDLGAGPLDDHAAERVPARHARGDDSKYPGECLGSGAGRDGALD
jgi:hypothetical protein